MRRIVVSWKRYHGLPQSVQRPTQAVRVDQGEVDKGAIPGAVILIARGDATNRSNWPSGGVGMQSTASDYARFAEMLSTRSCVAE